MRSAAGDACRAFDAAKTISNTSSNFQRSLTCSVAEGFLLLTTPPRSGAGPVALVLAAILHLVEDEAAADADVSFTARPRRLFSPSRRQAPGSADKTI